jgi:hypothetical protein
MYLPKIMNNINREAFFALESDRMNCAKCCAISVVNMSMRRGSGFFGGEY